MSSRKVYFLTAPEGETEIIGEEFVIPPHAVKEERVKAFGKKYTVHLFDGVEVEERWVREVWTGTRIGENIYCCIGPKEVQFRDADDPNSCKLGYHGVVFSNMNAESVALMDRMKPFQYLYFIVVHKLKRLIAKDKGQVFHMDLSMIPEKLGLEKTLYYLDEMDVDFFDPLKNAEKPGAYQRGKITGSTSRSNMQHIMSYIQLMDALDMQISDVAGITKQREGQIEASAAVTNTQETILRSSVITEAAYFSPHDKVWEEVMSSMVKVAQKTLKTSAIKQYVLDDLSVATLDATDADISDGSFGVFMSNNQKDHEVFETIKQLSLTLLQNEQANFSDIFTILKTDSIEEAETVIKKSEQRREQQMQQQQKMEQEQAEMQAQAVERQMEHELNKINLENQGDIVIKQMEIDANQGDRDQDAIPDELEIMKAQADFAFKKAQLALKEKELKIKSQQAAAKPAPASK